MVTMVMMVSSTMVTSTMVMAMVMAISRAYIVCGLYCLWLTSSMAYIVYGGFSRDEPTNGQSDSKE